MQPDQSDEWEKLIKKMTNEAIAQYQLQVEKPSKQNKIPQKSNEQRNEQKLERQQKKKVKKWKLKNQQNQNFQNEPNKELRKNEQPKGNQRLNQINIKDQIKQIISGEKTAKQLLNESISSTSRKNNSHQQNYRLPENNNRSRYMQQSKYQPKQSNTSRYDNNSFNKKQYTTYANKCFKFLKNCEKLNQKQQELQNQIRKIKKNFFNTQIVQSYSRRPEQVVVFKCLDYPMVFIEYEYQKQKRYMRLSDLKYVFRNKIADFHQIVKKIFDMHYIPVETHFEQAILDFAIVRKKQIKTNIIVNKIFRQGQKQIEKLFYYCLNQNRIIQLVYFDQNMSDVLFGQSFVVQNKQKLPKSFEIFQQLAKQIRNQEINVADFGQEQLQSDNQQQTNNHGPIQTKQYIESELKKTQSRLNQILGKDLTQLQQSLQKKNNELLQRTKNDYSNDLTAAKLQQQVDCLNRNIQNFKTVKNQVNTKRQAIDPKATERRKFETLRMCLKRMILAEKHLESKLPILGKKIQIFQSLNKNNLLILEGETGSGKSTQLPQLLCEYYKLFQDPLSKPVLITQPRKIATRSLAQRVASELQESASNFVDYVSSSSKIVNPKAKIIFKLDRLVLDELIESPTLDKYSCLVIDQAHERTISIDVILGLTKQLLKVRKDFKVIVTSASMDIFLFQKYFATKTLKVSGRLFPVRTLYFPSREEDVVKKITNVIERQLLTETSHLKDQYKGHILVFCADTAEIDRLCDIFYDRLNPKLFLVLPLHGKLQPQQQRKAFLKTKQHKLIFASRIAETAITIDGVKVVIDPGFDRQLHYDQKTKFSSMKHTQISQSSARQRAGRAGRTQQGFCFRLYTEQQFKNRAQNKKPQIRNMALDTLALRLKSLRIKNIFDFDYLQAPDKDGMHNSIQLLKLIGCLDKNQDITAIGQFLVKIPIQPFLARSVIEGLLMEKTINIYPKFQNKFKFLTSTIIQILCLILNANNLFRIPQNFREKGEFIKYEKFSHQKGDFFFLKKIYDQFIFQSKEGKRIKDWLRTNFLMGKTLYQIKQLAKQIENIAKNFQINEDEMEQEIKKCKRKLEIYSSNEEDIILSCLTTSFCANICLYSGNPFIGYTNLSQKKTMAIYGTSCLSLLGLCPKWILSYDLYEGQKGRLFCRIANEITFDFIKNTVDPYVRQKFKIDEAQKINPFYKQIDYNLQTLIISQLKLLYQNRQRKQAKFLSNIELKIDEEQNKVTFFIACDPANRNNKSEQQKAIEDYISTLTNKAKNDYMHNYIGNVFVSIGDGFKIKQISFLYNSTVFQIFNMDNEVYNEFCNNWEGIGRMQTYGQQRIKIFVQSEQDIRYIQEFLEFLKVQQKRRFDVKKELVDIRKKIPQTKIYLHWWAGKSQNDNLLFLYQSKENESKASDNLKYLEQALNQYNNQQRNSDKKKRRYKENITSKFGRIGLTKKGNGINVFKSQFDEVQAHRFLINLVSTGSIHYNFQMPSYIKKFRQPQRPDCEKSDSDWIKEIKYLVQPLSAKPQNCIRVWGYKLYDRQKDKTLSQYEKTFRIQLKAQIKTFDLKLLNKMKNQYEGKKFILGCQKMHVTSLFDQCIAAVDYKVFENLYDEYIYNVENFKLQYPSIIFDVIDVKARQNQRKTKRLVLVKSQNRQDLIKPLRVLGQLFTPKYIIIQDRQFQYLDNFQGGKILDWIEEQYEYKIYFGFDRYQRKIKLYCHDSKIQQIQERLRFYLKKSKHHDELISYKGKNLKRVELILKRKQEELRVMKKKKDRFLTYEIRFTARQVFVCGDFQTFQSVKKQINQVKSKETSNQCQICNDIMTTPYKLFNCGHRFCWSCLANQIRQYKNRSNQNELKCSYLMDQKTSKICSKLMNINDVSAILSEQELQKMCDVRISHFVQSSSQYVNCSSPNCEQIFDRDQMQKEDEIDCELCGKNYCINCGNSHRNYTCDQWSGRNQISQQNLKQIGVKKCPKCKNGIKKDGGCNHISCRCGAHICWKCLKYFQTSKQCYDHLGKQCGGIFDAGIDH